MANAVTYRTLALTLSGAVAIVAATLLVESASPDGVDAVDMLRTGLVAVTAFWLAWGGAAGLMGIFSGPGAPATSAEDEYAPPSGQTVVVIPIYNEDPVQTFSRLAAMNRSLVRLGLADRFHFAILSDTSSPTIARLEITWLRRLLDEPEAEGRIFYRRRTNNIGKKAGNIEEFIRRSGGAYDYAIILDADSLMEGATMAELARRMDREPQLALLQTLPRIIHARTLFGRAIQFSSTYLSPVFARGIALMQGNEGPFWGHNAIVRVSAFAASCGLPVLSGKAPAGGHILSHDYVEAAMLARAGWQVRLDPDLQGSYEEGPENLIEFAKRDRRWCQGNLQHRRVLGAPGFRFWNRFTLLQGIMSYLASPLWLLLLVSSVVAAAQPVPPFIDRRLLEMADQAAWNLLIGVGMLLIVPKLVVLIRRGLGHDNPAFGGTMLVLASAGLEIVLSTLLAPTLLLLQTRSVLQVLFGIDVGWPPTRRGATGVDLAESWAHGWWIVACGFTLLAVTMAMAPHSVPWMLPVVTPMALAPVLIWLSARPADRGLLARLFIVPEELVPSPVMLERRRVLSRWRSLLRRPHFAPSAKIPARALTKGATS